MQCNSFFFLCFLLISSSSPSTFSRQFFFFLCRIDGYYLYSFGSPYLYTGIVMVVGYIGALISGLNPNSQFRYHIPFSVIAIFGFSVHGSGAVLGQPAGDYIVLASALISAAMMSLFFAFHPTRRSDVDLPRSACVRGVAGAGRRSYFMLLVLENPTRQPVPPGSLFNIYDKRGGGYPFTHSHPFPVFSSSPKRLVFFIRCRDRKNKARPSFTRVLYKNINNGSYLRYCLLLFFLFLFLCYVLFFDHIQI